MTMSNGSSSPTPGTTLSSSSWGDRATPRRGRASARAAPTAVRERWEPESTADNLKLVRASRAEGQVIERADNIEGDLRAAEGA